MTIKEGNPLCKHKWIYSSFVAASNPPIYQKICSKCGRIETESGEYYDFYAFQKVYNRFHGKGDKTSTEVKEGSSIPPNGDGRYGYYCKNCLSKAKEKWGREPNYDILVLFGSKVSCSLCGDIIRPNHTFWVFYDELSDTMWTNEQLEELSRVSPIPRRRYE